MNPVNKRIRLSKEQEETYQQNLIDAVNNASKQNLSSMEEVIDLWKEDNRAFWGIWQVIDQKMGRTNNTRNSFSYKHFIEKYLINSKEPWPEDLAEKMLAETREMVMNRASFYSQRQHHRDGIQYIMSEIQHKYDLKTKYAKYPLKKMMDRIRKEATNAMLELSDGTNKKPKEKPAQRVRLVVGPGLNEGMQQKLNTLIIMRAAIAVSMPFMSMDEVVALFKEDRSALAGMWPEVNQLVDNKTDSYEYFHQFIRRQQKATNQQQETLQ